MKAAKGVTLLEFMIVIMVISILSALLFPSLRIAREKGKTVLCASNLKQIGYALMMYEKDWPPFLPKACGGCQWGGSKDGWTEQIYPYVQSKGVFKCPSQPEESMGEFGYFLNSRPAYNNGYDYLRYNIIKDPQRFILAGDCTFKFSRWDCDKDNYTQQCLFCQGTAHYEDNFHLRKNNVLFADGHVKLYSEFRAEEMMIFYDVEGPWVQP